MKINILIEASLQSILDEMNSYPSLGLVSEVNSGCHTDMDITTFQKSFEIFSPFLNEIVTSLDKINSFNDLRKIGYKYEQLMFQKTNGVNTHKGLIFSLCIFFYGLIYNSSRESFIPFTKNFVSCLKDDFKTTGDSVGLKLFQEKNIKGARHIAMNGYEIVFDAYDFYKNYLKSQDLTIAQTNFCLLLFFTINIQDTTLINKIGEDKFLIIKEKFSSLLEKLKVNYKSHEDEVATLNDFAISNKVSPGGAADLVVLVDTLIKINF